VQNVSLLYQIYLA